MWVHSHVVDEQTRWWLIRTRFKVRWVVWMVLAVNGWLNIRPLYHCTVHHWLTAGRRREFYFFVAKTFGSTVTKYLLPHCRFLFSRAQYLQNIKKNCSGQMINHNTWTVIWYRICAMVLKSRRAFENLSISRLTHNSPFPSQPTLLLSFQHYLFCKLPMWSTTQPFELMLCITSNTGDLNFGN